MPPPLHLSLDMQERKQQEDSLLFGILVFSPLYSVKFSAPTKQSSLSLFQPVAFIFLQLSPEVKDARR